MYIRSPLPTLSQDSNQKITNLRRHLHQDVLKYNQQQYNNRRNQARLNRSMEHQQIQQRMMKQQQYLRRQDQQKRLNIIQKRRILREQYERQIKEKLDRQNKQKQYDNAYAKIQRQYVEYSNERRVKDIQRMFSRKIYQASINDDLLKYKNHASYNHLSERKRINTEPLHNPESQNARQYSQQRSYGHNANIASKSNLKYKDSLDKLQIPDQSRQTPSRYKNKNLISSNVNVSINPSQPQNVIKNTNNINTNANMKIQSLNIQKSSGNTIFRPSGANNNFRMNYS